MIRDESDDLFGLPWWGWLLISVAFAVVAVATAGR